MNKMVTSRHENVCVSTSSLHDTVPSVAWVKLSGGTQMVASVLRECMRLQKREKQPRKAENHHHPFALTIHCFLKHILGHPLLTLTFSSQPSRCVHDCTIYRPPSPKKSVCERNPQVSALGKKVLAVTQLQMVGRSASCGGKPNTDPLSHNVKLGHQLG